MPATCSSSEDMARLDGQLVSAEGIYRRLLQPIAMPRPGRPPPEERFLGRVVLELGGSPRAYAPSAWERDRTLLQLGQQARPDPELAALEGRRVRVQGRLVLDPTVLLSDEEREQARPDPLPLLHEPGVVEALD